MAIMEGLEPRKTGQIMGGLFKSKVWVSSGKAISEVPWGRDFGTLLDTAGDPEAVVGHPAAAPQDGFPGRPKTGW